MKEQGVSRLSKILDIILAFIVFGTLRYVLIGCKYAFQESAIYAFFFMIDVYIILKYWQALERYVSNKLLRVLIMIAAFTVIATTVYYVGYLDVSPILRRW